MHSRTMKWSVMLVAMLSCGILHADHHKKQAGKEVNPHEHKNTKSEVKMPDLGVVILRPTKDNKARGTLRLIQEGDNLHIRGQVRNLAPGLHGFHIHEYGDLRSPDGTSAGGHFAPFGHDHGKPGGKSHVGDLGNIEADDEGVAKVNMVVQNLQLHFILGRSFVVHAGEDDLSSQPSGNAGPRVAVGTVAVANPEIKRVRPAK